MAASIDDAMNTLLEWLYGSDQGQSRDFANVADLEADWNSDDMAYTVTKHAENHGYVRGIYSMGGGASATIMPAGISYVERLRAERSNPAKRVPALRSSMLRWLYEQDASGVDADSWDGFFKSDRANHYGQHFGEREVERQAAYLYRTGMVSAVPVEEAEPGTISPSLTDSGHDCVVDYGGNVSEYASRNTRSGDTNNVYLSDNKGNLTVGGSNFTQNVTNGVDTSELLKFAGAVRQVLPTLVFPDETAERLDHEALELHEAASQPTPDVGAMRRLWSGVMEKFTFAVPTVTGDLVIELGQKAIESIGN